MSRYTYADEAADAARDRSTADEMRTRKAPFAMTLELRAREAMVNVDFDAKWAEAWARYDRISDDLSHYQSFDVPQALRADLAGLVDKLEGMTK